MGCHAHLQGIIPTQRSNLCLLLLQARSLSLVPPRKPSAHWLSYLFIISWRLITLQYCSGFCHTLTWISQLIRWAKHQVPVLKSWILEGSPKTFWFKSCLWEGITGNVRWIGLFFLFWYLQRGDTPILSCTMQDYKLGEQKRKMKSLPLRNLHALPREMPQMPIPHTPQNFFGL